MWYKGVVKKEQGPLGSPCNQDPNKLGSILGPLSKEAPIEPPPEHHFMLPMAPFAFGSLLLQTIPCQERPLLLMRLQLLQLHERIRVRSSRTEACFPKQVLRCKTGPLMCTQHDASDATQSFVFLFLWLPSISQVSSPTCRRSPVSSGSATSGS